MTFWTLIRRSLRFHARAHLGVVLGAAIGSAALIGALVVGDSVRESLTDMALRRLGKHPLCPQHAGSPVPGEPRVAPLGAPGRQTSIRVGSGVPLSIPSPLSRQSSALVASRHRCQAGRHRARQPRQCARSGCLGHGRAWLIGESCPRRDKPSRLPKAASGCAATPC